MNPQLTEISKNVLKNCLGLREQETFLVVSDEEKKELAESLYEAGRSLGAEAMLVVMKGRSKPGEEPPAPIAAAMSGSQVVVCITEYSLTHTKARKQAAADRRPGGHHAGNYGGHVPGRSHLRRLYPG
ncbi:hypothetical protein LJK87_45400 [Paenibacillus sp. P25]|nr:hypothetical protein LJK87_45400 [Paenibacillus sp. P25]